MKIAIGSDKSGFSAKEAIKAYLTEAGVEFDDLGTVDPDHVLPYYAVAEKVAPFPKKEAQRDQRESDQEKLPSGQHAPGCARVVHVGQLQKAVDHRRAGADGRKIELNEILA